MDPSARNHENINNLEIIDNEKINKGLELLENKIDVTINEKTKALELLNKIDNAEISDIDLVRDSKGLYYLVLGNSEIIKNGDLSEENLELIKYLPFAGSDIDGLEKIVNYMLNENKKEQN